MRSSDAILLVRHGRVDFGFDLRVRGSDLGALVVRFDRAGIRADSGPSRALYRRAGEAAVVVSSDLRRAVHSAMLLARGRPHLVEEVFREAALPARLPFAATLRFRTWLVLARLLWRLGWAHGAESYGRVRIRALRAALRLEELSAAQGDVVLVGHGYFSGLVAAALRRRGWRGPLRPPVHNWGWAVYRRQRVQ